MAIIDKFNIIENHLTHESQKDIDSKIINYFENFITTDIKVLPYDYISMASWFKMIPKTNIHNIIITQIKSYLTNCRNNIRSVIKRQSFELSYLNKLLKRFMNKLDYIVNIVRENDDIIKIECIKYLSNLIITDSIILMFLEETIILFDKDLKNDFKEFFNFCKSIGSYDEMETLNKMLKTIGNIFKRDLINTMDIPLPENIKRLQNISNTINICIKVLNYFDHIKEYQNKFISSLLLSFLENLNDIIKHNLLSEIEFVFTQITKSYNQLIGTNEFDGKEEILKNIAHNIMQVISKNLVEDKLLQVFNIIRLTENIITNNDMRSTIDSWISKLFSQENIIILVNNMIDMYMMSDDDNIELINKIIIYSSNTKEKDMFIEKYYNNMIRRMMNIIINYSKLKDRINIETKILEFLKQYFPEKLLYRLNKVLADTRQSIEDNVEFNKLVSSSSNHFVNKMKTITTSYNNWDINQTEGFITPTVVESLGTTIMGKHLRNYTKYYDMRYSMKRMLYWFPHFGEVSMNYMNKELIVLPIQFMVIELFSNNDTIVLDEVRNSGFFANYSRKFVNDIIGSLVVSQLFKIIGNNMVLQDSDFETNLISIFFTHSDYADVWEQKRVEEFVHSRIEITTAMINHIVKQKSLNLKELYQETNKNITIFQLDEEMFNKSIQYMIKYDYILCKNDFVEKIFY